ncbi:MAG TPA: thioredoxin family protein [Nitrososphaera sp.]|jgi:thioredoxin 1
MAVETITAKSWEEKVINSKIPVVVNFSAAYCGFCMMLDPLYSMLSDRYAGKLSFLKLMADEPQSQELLERISIDGTPTLKFYCQGREVGEHVGYAIEPVLRKKIDCMLDEMDECIKNSTPLPHQEK